MQQAIVFWTTEPAGFQGDPRFLFSTVVFLETIEGFVPQPVRISRMDAVRAEVLDGLSAGDRYVSAGGFTLKAELGKESFGDGHGH